jgi:hypothetical protein
MLLNILCSCICSYIILRLINGWKILVITSNMRLQRWLYMSRGVFLWLVVFCHFSKVITGFVITCVSYNFLKKKKSKIVVVYFQISFSVNWKVYFKFISNFFTIFLQKSKVAFGSHKNRLMRWKIKGVSSWKTWKWNELPCLA